MDAIETIIEQINTQAAAERKVFRDAETKKVDAAFKSEKARVIADHEKKLAKQLKNAESKYKQLRSRQEVEVRQATLIEKQNYLSQIFEEAYQAMVAWDQATVQAFVANCLQALPLKKTATLHLASEMDDQLLSEQWLTKVNQTLPYKIQLGGKLPSSGHGFIVDDQGVQYNFLYRDLLTEIKRAEGNEIAQELFE